MSVCQFDRTDVLARPLMRDRGGSICHFDRMDVLARPLQRDRIGSAYHFDRTDVLARPNFVLGKSLLRERRVSVNFLEKDEEAGRGIAKDSRSSIGNIDKIEKERVLKEEMENDVEKQGTFVECSTAEKGSMNYQYDQPSCSKTSDAGFGYRATCV